MTTDHRELLGSVLTENGYRVAHREDGSRGVALFKQHAPTSTS